MQKFDQLLEPCYNLNNPFRGLIFFKEETCMRSIATIRRGWENQVGGDIYYEP